MERVLWGESAQDMLTMRGKDPGKSSANKASAGIFINRLDP